MPRPMKTGVDYFPLDVTLDDKFELIEAEFGLKGFAVVVKLLQRIYGQRGYYCEWNDEVSLLFGKKIGLGGNDVSEIVNASIRRGIFDQSMYDQYGILTSAGIQKRYLEATARRKVVTIESAYLLLDLAILSENADTNGVNADINSKSAGNNPQSKVNKTKRNKSSNVVKPDDDLTDYLEQNLWRMSAGNYSDLRELMADGIPEELVRHAVDCATERGKPSWGYVRSILNRWLVEGVRTVGEARAAHARFVQKAAREGQPPQRPVSPTIDELGGSGSLYK